MNGSNDHHSRSDAAPPRGRAMDFRPTLFGEEESPADADGLRILGSLQAPPPPRHRRGRWAAGGLLAAAALVAAAGLGLWFADRSAQAVYAPDAAATPPVDAGLATHQPTSAGPAARPAASPASAASVGDAGDAGHAAIPAGGAARIESDTVPAVAVVAARDPFARLQPSASASAAVEVQGAPAAIAAAPVAVRAGSSGPRPAAGPSTQLARAEPHRQAVAAQPAAKADAKADVKATTQPARRAADEDVELIEAVVSHGNGRKRPAQPAARPASAGGRGQGRDVVQRQAPADSTAELLQRCDDVGGLEGVLCRWRICADRWGQDPACPKNSPRPYRQPS